MLRFSALTKLLPHETQHLRHETMREVIRIARRFGVSKFQKVVVSRSHPVQAFTNIAYNIFKLSWKEVFRLAEFVGWILKRFVLLEMACSIPLYMRLIDLVQLRHWICGSTR